jgi:hypothetical protein
MICDHTALQQQQAVKQCKDLALRLVDAADDCAVLSDLVQSLAELEGSH